MAELDDQKMLIFGGRRRYRKVPSTPVIILDTKTMQVCSRFEHEDQRNDFFAKPHTLTTRGRVIAVSKIVDVTPGDVRQTNYKWCRMRGDRICKQLVEISNDGKKITPLCYPE